MILIISILCAFCVGLHAEGAGLMPTIVLDAGHGGTDLGAKRHVPYCEEKRITLQTARFVRKYLTQLGYHVIMTRDVDAFIPLERRVEIANQTPLALFVSIHFNSCKTPTARGVEVYFYDSRENRARTGASKLLASSILRRIIRYTSAASRGVKAGSYYVLRETEIPAVIVEGGFISNPEERVLLKQTEYLQKIGRGIADGVHFYLESKKEKVVLGAS